MLESRDSELIGGLGMETFVDGIKNPIISVLLCLGILISISSSSSASDFTATTLGDYGTVTVMETSGNYDAKQADGTPNAGPRQAIAKEFFRLHKDEYDFLVVFSNFDFTMPDEDAGAFYMGVKNDVKGIARELFDYSGLFGSNGKLQGTVDMGNISKLTTDPMDAQFEATFRLLGHEVMHRWGAYVSFRDSSGTVSTGLLSGDHSHWSFLLDTKASLLYGNQWQDNGNGTFTSVAAEDYYSPLDLYLMGMYDKSQVPAMLLINNPEIDPSRQPEVGSAVSGNATTVSIDQIIAAEGERVPNATQSQKEFKTAFILITTPGTFSEDVLSGIENIRDGWITRFSILTDGKGLMQVSPDESDDIAKNPGVTLPGSEPRALPPSIDDGVAWLLAAQKIDGSWADLSQTAGRDTTEAVLALKNFDAAKQNYSAGIQWLEGAAPENTDYLAREMEALSGAGGDTTGLIQQVIYMQNSDGGWGSSEGLISDVPDTALALKALGKAGYTGQDSGLAVSKAIEYLKSAQNSDSGWGTDDGESKVMPTASVLSALNVYRDSYQISDIITNGAAWLVQKQNSDGGFGNSPSTLYNTAVAAATLTELGYSRDVINKALTYILNSQSADGSWNKSPYQTALAVNTIWNSEEEADLSIEQSDITFMPQSISTLPSNVVVSATINNFGRTSVASANVALYDGDPSLGKKLAEQAASFPDQTSTAVSFSTTISDGNQHSFYIYIDPDNLVQESNKKNNVAFNVLTPDYTYDFEIIPSDISFSQNPVGVFKDLQITAKISNKGTMNAYSVQVRYFIDQAGGPLEIATATVDIPAGGTVTSNATWHTAFAGNALPLTIQIDPLGKFQELSEDNNTAVGYVTVSASSSPNLTISYKDISVTPNPVNQYGTVNVSAVIGNSGYSAAEDIQVNFYKGTPGLDGVLLGTIPIASLNPGESRSVSFDWTNISDSGEKIIYIKVDPDNLIEEVSEDDNGAFVTLSILSLPDLSISPDYIVFNPPAPAPGTAGSIKVTVKNNGDQEASNVTVRALDGDNVIGSIAVPTISGNSLATTSFSYETSGRNETHQITIVVDPDDLIAELSESNNRASKSLSVQSEKIGVTEQYISPNGDGVKDTTDFYFRLDVPQTVTVAVMNKTGQTVKTFNGPELNNTSGGIVTWDGLDDNGMVVADGQYNIRLTGSGNSQLGSASVTVDNNRSPLTDAIGTPYLASSNLTCKMPGIWDWQWLPNESGILFNVYSINVYNSDFSLFQQGIYRISPDGSESVQIVGSDGSGFNFFDKFSISPDGSEIAFSWDRCSSGPCDDGLWISDIDGKKLTKLDTVSGGNVTDINWAAAGKSLAYVTLTGAYLENLTFIDVETKARVVLEENVYIGDAIWSPNGQNLAYYVGDEFGPYDIMLVDRSGNKKTIFSFPGTPRWNASPQLKWLNNETIISSTKEWCSDLGYDKIMLRTIDVNSGVVSVLYDSSQSGGSFTLSPDGASIAYIVYDYDNSLLKIFDGNGNLTLDYELKSGAIDGVAWSEDGDELFFSLHRFTDQSNELDVADMGTKKVSNLFALPSEIGIEKMLSDGATLSSGNYLINIQTGNIVVFNGSSFSPLENYYMSSQSIDDSSSCYSGPYSISGWPYYENKDSDLLAVRSLLNLSAELIISKQDSSVLLKGTATDLNFDSYTLEYSDADAPGTWKLIAPSSQTQVISDVFTTWTPPYKATFYVRLTAVDKAGNSATSTQLLQWSEAASITNIYTSRNIFSPNGDGVADTVELNYKILDPVHLEFNIYDTNNTVIRTITKDYSEPGSDYMSWDGRDEKGNMAIDGQYTIRVFDYDFYVEVDNTPPDAVIYFDGFKQDGLTMALSVDVKGRAADKNLKNWIIEYGEGDNPSQWQEYTSGSSQIGEKDANGNISDAAAATVRDNDIELMVGKKVRITVQDLAGNTSAVVSDFLAEEIVLDKYQWNGVWNPILLSQPDSLYSDLGKAGSFVLGGLETIRQPLSSLSVQYAIDGQWLETGPVSSPSPGAVSLQWDNASSGSADAIRLKAVDSLGMEHYSNVALIRELFSISMCEGYARNYLFESLGTLRFQVRSDEDSHYKNWTDYKVYDVSRGDQIPIGKFVFPLISDGVKDLSYYYRMLGTGVSGAGYESNSAQYPDPSCVSPLPVSFEVSVQYQETDCGLKSTQATISATATGLAGVSVQNLSIAIQKPEGQEILTQCGSSSCGITMDISDMTEGDYPLQADMTYLSLSDNTVHDMTASGTLSVDHVLPTAGITYPTATAVLCPSKQTGVGGDWNGIAIQGVAQDNKQLKSYSLLYGTGSNPLSWQPALTKRYNKDVSIEGTVPIKGQLGIWDVSTVQGTTFALKLKVVDVAGNSSCSSVSFSIDNSTNIAELSAEKSPFSTGVDGSVDITFRIDEYATVDAKVYKLNEVEGTYTLDSTPVRTIAAGAQHLQGSERISWDGRDDTGSTVADGIYGVTVSAKDSCGNSSTTWIPIEVDNTPPKAVITLLEAGSSSGSVVEVRGTATDLNFGHYALEAGQGDDPGTWYAISSGTSAVSDGVLGDWNTYGLSGKWIVRLTAIDAAGNESSASITLDLSTGMNLIKDISVSPALFSPNNDGKLDTTTITYSLADPSRLELDIVDSAGGIRRTSTADIGAPGSYGFIWDGKDNSGATVFDGAYKARLSASTTQDSSSVQQEDVTVTVDTTPPIIDIQQPQDGAFLSSDIAVSGSITDANLSSYSVSYTGDSGTVLIDSGSQNRAGYLFGTIRNLPEGSYTLNASAKDLVENSASKNTVFTIDRTPPAISLSSPKGGEYYGGLTTVVNIAGYVVEKNLDRYSIRYGSGDNPSQWIEITGGGSLPSSSELSSWKVGKNDGVADGRYTVSLYAKDKAGLTGEVKAGVTIDNTPPSVSLTSISEGGYFKTATDIIGTVSDTNLDKYSVELSPGDCTGASQWSSLRTWTLSVTNGTMASLQALPAEGSYCLRATAQDKAVNKTEVKINVKVDTHPPASPVLSGSVDNGINASLTWTANSETDLAGYNIYRKGQKLNSGIIKNTAYLDQNLTAGSYSYAVKAVDLAGWESAQSNEVTLTISTRNPANAHVSSPSDGARVSGLVTIKGTAYSSDSFKEYRIYIGEGTNPSAWTLIRQSPVPVPYGTLSQWDTTSLPEISYTIKLEAETIYGDVSTAQLYVTVDHTQPSAPSLTSVTASSSNVTAVWQANPESDLAGYLLYRNDQLVNSASITVSSLSQYLIQSTTYLDKNVADGKFRYYLIAMDQAGNMSVKSNTIEVSMDTHPPHMTIVEPADGTKFDGKIFIKATSDDSDISVVQFQYKRSQDTAWTNMGVAIAQSPYTTYLDPTSLGLIYNSSYNLRAIAADAGGKTDPSPGFIALNYEDVTPPGAPKNLKAYETGKDISLTWSANSETDLNGYNVYRVTGGGSTKLNASIIKETNYLDKSLPDSSYNYSVTAVDTQGNESDHSAGASATVYAPSIDQPYTPVNKTVMEVTGSGATSSASVEMLDQTANEYLSEGTVKANGEGNFVFPELTLGRGENRIVARAKDDTGNTSRDSDEVVVVYDQPPAAPTGLSGSINGEEIDLSWNANAEGNLSGYNLYRNGDKVNAPVMIMQGTITDSSSANYSFPSYSGGDYLSFNWSYSSSGTFTPVWLEIDLPAAELISHLGIKWAWSQQSDGSETVYAGKDFTIQVWSGYAWITREEITGNSEKENVFDFEPSYRTDKIRIKINDVTDNDNDNLESVLINGISIMKDDLITNTSLADDNSASGSYNYRVTAVDYYGFESEPSNEINVTTHDAPASPQGLSATASGGNVLLSWKSCSSSDLYGYFVYRKGDRGWSKLNTSAIADTSYTDAGLQNGTYTYMVTAMDIYSTESSPSNEASAAVYVSSIPAPANLTATASGSNVSLNWSAGSGTNFPMYNIYRNDGRGWVISRNSVWGSSYTDTCVPNGAYSYRVVGLDSSYREGPPSNEATVTVSKVPPQPPSNLRVEPLQEGSSLKISWQDSDTSVTGYNVYRSAVSGGPYAKVNGISTRPTSYIDVMLADGASYYYVATAVDCAGNESSYSSEAFGVPSAASSLQQPVILVPTVAGAPATLYENKTEISGSATQGTEIQLFKNGVGVVSTAAAQTDYVESSPISVGIDSLSPDGRLVAYIAYSQDEIPAIRLKDLATGSDTEVWQNVSGGSVWSPDSSKIAFSYYDSQWNERIGFYDIDSGVFSNLTDDTYSSNTRKIETQPSWSKDGSRIVFMTYNASWFPEIWMKDFDSGNLSKMMDGSYDIRIFAISSDGKLLAYMNRQALYIRDIASGSTQIVDANVAGWGWSTPWSPVSEKLTFESYSSNYTNSYINVFDAATGQKTVITDPSKGNYWPNSPVWSPDGKRISFTDYYQNDTGQSLWIGDAVSGGGSRMAAHASSSSLSLMAWLTTGAIAYYDNGTLDKLYPGGYFNFEDVQLDSGENVFYVTSSDGQSSLSSEPISVKYTSGYDIEVRSENISLSLTSPAVGEDVTITVGVKNTGVADANDVDLNLYLFDASRSKRLLGSATIPFISVGSEQQVSFSWICDGEPGAGEIIAVADPVDKIAESDESNNSAGRAIEIVSGQITLSGSSDGSNASLTWTPSLESDLSGYSVYKKGDNSWAKLNSDLLSDVFYTDPGLPNGTYWYIVKAVSMDGTEGPASNEASVTISVVLPQSPKLTAASMLEECSVIASWVYEGEPGGRYILYRSTASGGPYVEVTNTSLSSYNDTGLTNGAAYYYVVTALDAVGNESSHSNEVRVVPEDTTPPSKPTVFFPTIPAIPLTSTEETANIIGWADPGTSVTVLSNDIAQGTASALAGNVTTEIPLQAQIYSLDISRDGKWAVFADDSQEIFITDLEKQSINDISQHGSFPRWSPDSRKISFISNGKKIMLYKVEDASVSEAISATYELYGYAWSPDFRKIAYSTPGSEGEYEIWTKDIQTGESSQITSAQNAAYPIWSPDGKKIAYWNEETGFFSYIDLETGNSATIGASDSPHSYERAYQWSPDGSSLAYSNSGAMRVTNVATGQTTAYTPIGSSEGRPAWSPDGSKIAFAHKDPSSAAFLIGIRDLATGQVNSINNDGPGSDHYHIVWSNAGRLLFNSNRDSAGPRLDARDFAGTFRLDNMPLASGENLITVIAADDSGNTSPFSDAISLSLDTSQSPDLEITADDISVYPAVPLVGDGIAINVGIRNKSQVDIANVDLDIYLEDPDGRLTLLKSDTVSLIKAGSEESIGTAWAGNSRTGTYKVLAISDPKDSIKESDETNNYAIKELIVAGDETIQMNTTLDSGSYHSNQTVNIDVNLLNPGSEKTLTLETSIEDSSGERVALVATRTVDAAYGSQDLKFSWNTGSTYAGDYRVQTILYDNTGAKIENAAPLSIVADMTVAATVTSDKNNYGPNEDVHLIVTVKNIGLNYIIPEAEAQEKIVDSSGNALYTKNIDLNNLFPGVESSLSYSWATAQLPAGDYSGTVDVLINGSVAASSVSTFKINEVFNAKGSVSTDRASYNPGETVQVTYGVKNSGNFDVNDLTLNINVIDPSTQNIVGTIKDTADIVMGGDRTGQSSFSTSGLGSKTYTVILQCAYNGSTVTIASASFKITDTEPPALTVISPASGILYAAKIDIAAMASDESSGMDKLEYQIDGGAWASLPLIDAILGRYATTWNCTRDGSHTISFRATDKVGNRSPEVSSTISVDGTPPAGNIAINGGSEYTNNTAVDLSLNAADTGSGVVKMCVSDSYSCTEWESYSVTRKWTLPSGEGKKTVYVWYQDNLGNIDAAPYTASVTLDTTPPALKVSTLSDGGITNKGILNVAGTATDDAGIRTITVNDAAATLNTDGSFSYPLSLQDGPNELVVIAADLAGTETTETRTITLDQVAPVITLTSPADNIATKQTPLEVSGRVDDQATVSVTVNASDPVPVIMTGNSFSFSVTPVYGINTIEVSATDLAGNVSTEKRTLTFDDQNPSLSITYPAQDVKTNRADMVIKGEISDLTAVSITITMVGATYSPPVIEGKFEQPLTFPAEGTYQIFITAVDAAGGGTVVQRNVIYDITDSLPPATTLSLGAPHYTSNGELYVTSGTSFTLSATDDYSGVAKTEYSIDGGEWTTYAPFSISEEGSHTVEYRSVDSFGNVEAVQKLTVIVDNTPPVCNVVINAGAMYANSASVNLTLDAADEGSGVAKMCVSDNPSCTAWESYSPTKNWKFAGDGKKNIFIWLEDNLLNSDPAPCSSSVVVDTIPPSSIITSPSASVITAPSLQIRGTSSDVGSGVRKVEVSTDGGATWSIASGTTSWSFAWTVPSDGTYTLRSRAADGAGNIEIPGPGITIVAYNRESSIVSINDRRLLVNGAEFLMKGVVYSPVPIGDDPETMPPYGDYFTGDYKNLYGRDLPILRDMGANVLRLSLDQKADHHEFLDRAYNDGLDPIYVIAGFPLSPGLDIDPISNGNVRELLKSDFRAMVATNKNHPAILMWEIGSNLNSDSMYGGNLDDLFSLIHEMAGEAHAEEGSNRHPVAVSLADSDLISTISRYDASATALDIWGANVYRGDSFGTLFEDYRNVSSKPLAILEYGIDAYDNLHNNVYEDIGIPYQAVYAEALWNEIASHSDVCIGGSLMEYSDEWWTGKYSAGSGCPDTGPALHTACGSTTASSPDGYDNKEWWGIMRPRSSASGPDTLEPRAVYTTLQGLWTGSVAGKHSTTVHYTGSATGVYHDSVALSGTLADATAGMPMAGEAITFVVGSQSCTATTDSGGNASCEITLAQTPGDYTASINFEGDEEHAPASAALSFSIDTKETVLTYTGPSFIAQGTAAAFSAVLSEASATTGPSGRRVVFSLGSGAQSCSGQTDSNGTVSCTIDPISASISLGATTVTVSFNGDSYYEASSAAESITVAAFPVGGSFVIGDVNAVICSSVTFWGAQWQERNSLSVGSAPASFKGYVEITSTTPPRCGGTWQWSASSGDSSNPPSTVPSYMAVIASGEITKSGSAILGSTAKIIIIKTDIGYTTNPGHAGTGTVIGLLCQ